MITATSTAVYSLFHALTLVVGLPLFLTHRKLRRGLFGRIKNLNQLPTVERPFWLHVASSGELEQALPIVDNLKRMVPQVPILLTYFSPSAEKAIALEKERRRAAGSTVPWNAALYAPIDLPWFTDRFVIHFKPRALVLIHREIWPNLVRAALSQKVPLYWMNVSFPKGVPGWLALFKGALSQFRWMGTVDSETAKALEKRFALPVPIEVSGDSRIDRVISRKKLRGNPAGVSRDGLRLLLASLWPEDWKAVRSTVLQCVESGTLQSVWIFPHEIHDEFTKVIENDFASRKLPLRVFSERREVELTESHALFNMVGYLAEMYAYCDLVFVGGSFKAKVHNVLEPGVYSKPVMTGPLIENSFEAKEFRKYGGLFSGDAAAFSESLPKLCADSAKRDEAARALESYFAQHAGAAEKYAAVLKGVTLLPGPKGTGHTDPESR